MTWFNLLGGVRSWWLLAGGTLALGVILNATVNRRTALRSAERWENPESRRERDLEQERRALKVRIEGKAHIVDEFLGGRMLLLEAAAGFRTLDRMQPCRHEGYCREKRLGTSEEERCCRVVIYWVWVTLARRDPCLATIACARLEDQLNDHLRRGPLHLPEIDLCSLRQSSEPD